MSTRWLLPALWTQPRTIRAAQDAAIALDLRADADSPMSAPREWVREVDGDPGVGNPPATGIY